MANTIFIGFLLVIILIISIIALGYRRQAKQTEREFRELLEGFTASNSLVEAAQSTAANYLDACRLIAIHRSGRMNTFTFVRGHTSFMIQTMGLMSDVPDDWRRQAGLLEPLDYGRGLYTDTTK